MRPNKLLPYAIASLMVFASGASVQAQTMEDCEAGIEAVRDYIPEHPDIPARETATDQLQMASTAMDEGDLDACMLHVREAAGALNCSYGAANRLECD